MMKDFPLEYLIRPAKNTSGKAPAIFMVHGYGSNMQDLFSFAPELPAEYCVISVQAPYPLPNFGYAWYAIDFTAEKWSDTEQAKKSQSLILEFIEQACTYYNLDKQRVTLLGFSQGCILGLSLALSYPEKIQRLVGLSGYLEKDMLPADYQKNNFSNLKIYLSHGTSDQVVPVAWARNTASFLEELGIDFVFEEFATGHTICLENFNSFLRWIKENA